MTTEHQKINNNAYNVSSYVHRSTQLVEELAVGVRPEEGLSHNGQGAVLEQRQSCLEGVVDLDLAASTDNQDTASTICVF